MAKQRVNLTGHTTRSEYVCGVLKTAAEAFAEDPPDWRELIADERKRQVDRWGQQTHDIEHWGMILGEEFGETCKAVLEHRATASRDWLHQITIEATQVAAVATRIMDWVQQREDELDAKKD